MTGLTFGEIHFSAVGIASGANGFNEEGYPFHKAWKYLGLTHKGCEFTAKSTGMKARKGPSQGGGNMPMKEDGITPQERFGSRCIVTNWRGDTLNTVGLPSPGAHALRELWRTRAGLPYWISFASSCKSLTDQQEELGEFIALLNPEIHQWNAQAGLELNFSCPNTEKDSDSTELSTFVSHVHDCLNIAAKLFIPIRCKFNALLDQAAALEISKHPSFDGLVMGNTIPWGCFSENIPWKTRFGEISPLLKRGFPLPGGLSGPLLRPIHCEWIEKARWAGFTKPIWGCGGIFSCCDIDHYARAGAAGIQFGSVCIHRPWRMRTLIQHAHEVDFTQKCFGS